MTDQGQRRNERTEKGGVHSTEYTIDSRKPILGNLGTPHNEMFVNVIDFTVIRRGRN